MKPCLAIIAGKGNLPALLINHLNNHDQPYILIGVDGQTPLELKDTIPAHIPTCWLKLGQIGKLLTFLKDHEAKQLVMIGGLRRPSWEELKLDAQGLKIMAKLAFKPKGDDAILSSAIKELETRGIKVKSLQDFMPTCLGGKGCLTTVSPSDQNVEDMRQGKIVLDTLSPLDIGQCVVVQQGLVLAVEAIEGTDETIARAGTLKREGTGPTLIKQPKLDQETRADLPTLGENTILAAHKAGFDGIAFSAGKTLLVDQESMVKQANKCKLFLYGMT